MYAPLTTVTAVREWLHLNEPADDGLLSSLVKVASELVGRYCGRPNLGEVLSYQEHYSRRTNSGFLPGGEFDVVLRHYPVVTLTSVLMNGPNSIAILTPAQLISNQAGVYLLEDEEPRILRFRSLWRDNSIPIQVTYTAGYPGIKVPVALQQAVNAYCAEIYKSQSWVGYRTKVLAGETVTYETGDNWGMSTRVQMMLNPYRNVVPFMGR
jgi:hypothetical protein